MADRHQELHAQIIANVKRNIATLDIGLLFADEMPTTRAARDTIIAYLEQDDASIDVNVLYAQYSAICDAIKLERVETVPHRERHRVKRKHAKRPLPTRK